MPAAMIQNVRRAGTAGILVFTEPDHHPAVAARPNKITQSTRSPRQTQVFTRRSSGTFFPALTAASIAPGHEFRVANTTSRRTSASDPKAIIHRNASRRSPGAEGKHGKFMASLSTGGSRLCNACHDDHWPAKAEPVVHGSYLKILFRNRQTKCSADSFTHWRPYLSAFLNGMELASSS